MTLKLRILRSLTRLFIILVSLTRSLFSEKMFISYRCIYSLMPNLIKKSWTVFNQASAIKQKSVAVCQYKMRPKKTISFSSNAHTKYKRSYRLGWPLKEFNLLFLCLFVNGDLVETHKRPMRFSFRSKFIEQNKMKSKPTISYAFRSLLEKFSKKTR